MNVAEIDIWRISAWRSISAILSEIFFQKLEEKHFNNLKLKYDISIISRYVDDILVIYNDEKYRYNEQTIVLPAKKYRIYLLNGNER